jgi:hypothetical protein
MVLAVAAETSAVEASAVKAKAEARAERVEAGVSVGVGVGVVEAISIGVGVTVSVGSVSVGWAAATIAAGGGSVRDKVGTGLRGIELNGVNVGAGEGDGVLLLDLDLLLIGWEGDGLAFEDADGVGGGVDGVEAVLEQRGLATREVDEDLGSIGGVVDADVGSTLSSTFSGVRATARTELSRPMRRMMPGAGWALAVPWVVERTWPAVKVVA